MNKLSLSVLIASLVLAFCKQPEKPATTKGTAPQATIQCFESRLPDGSVLKFQYSELNTEVGGVLEYDFAEKDDARGTFKGKKEGDIITAIWTHTVEGQTQSQEIMVKIEGDKAMKANGELESGQDGVLRLKDKATASWSETFERVTCE
ncbi:MAG: hypothetical protein KIS77_07205 [Saprospiraceae bacterium]|nr:hypothetical protein [Saprospiraceae bacterium]